MQLPSFAFIRDLLGPNHSSFSNVVVSENGTFDMVPEETSVEQFELTVNVL